MDWLEKKNRKLQLERARKLGEEMSEVCSQAPKINEYSQRLASSSKVNFMDR